MWQARGALTTRSRVRNRDKPEEKETEKEKDRSHRDSNNLEEHQKIVREVLQRLQDHDLYLCPEKCKFERSKIEYLGLVIRHGEVSMDPVKIEAILK